MRGNGSGARHLPLSRWTCAPSGPVRRRPRSPPVLPRDQRPEALQHEHVEHGDERDQQTLHPDAVAAGHPQPGEEEPDHENEAEGEEHEPPGVVPRAKIREDVLGKRALDESAQGTLRREKPRHRQGRNRETGRRRTGK